MERTCTNCGKKIGEKDTRFDFNVQRFIFISWDGPAGLQEGFDEKDVIVLCDPCAKKTTSVTIPIRDVIANFKTIEDYKRDPNCNLPEISRAE
jgi:hypothetical protein